VRDEVGARVAGMPRLVGDRAAGVTVVVADHEPAPIREHPAEARLPPEHRAADAHHQQDRRFVCVPKSLCAELDAIRFDQPLGHQRPASPSKRSLKLRLCASVIPLQRAAAKPESAASFSLAQNTTLTPFAWKNAISSISGA